MFVSTTMKYEDIVGELFRRFPQLYSEYHTKIIGEEDLPHLVFGDVVAEHLNVLLKTDTDPELREALFGYLEELCIQPDPQIPNVVKVSVLEEFFGDGRVWQKARTHMGPATLALAHELEQDA